MRTDSDNRDVNIRASPSGGATPSGIVGGPGAFSREPAASAGAALGATAVPAVGRTPRRRRASLARPCRPWHNPAPALAAGSRLNLLGLDITAAGDYIPPPLDRH